MSKVILTRPQAALDYQEIVNYLEEKDSAEFKDIIQEFESKGYTRGQINGRLRDGLDKGHFRKVSRGVYERVKPVEDPKDFVISEFSKTIDKIVKTEMKFSSTDEAREVSDFLNSIKDILKES